MGLFKSKYENELDRIILRLSMNLSNNYKDNAQENLKEFETALNEMKENGKLKPAVLKKYEVLLSEYQGKLQGYSHKDQKPYWT